MGISIKMQWKNHADAERMQMVRDIKKLNKYILSDLKGKKKHVKKMKVIYNRRFYLKKKKALEKYRKDIGEERSYYIIFLTKNRKKIDCLMRTFYKTRAYQRFNELIEDNQNTVKFPIKYEAKLKTITHTDVKYELLLIKRNDEDENNVSLLRNEQGTFVENVAGGYDNYQIIEKHLWLVEETFYVYGYHPKTDRKTYDFIYKNLVVNSPDTPDEMKRVVILNNKLIIDYVTDFDFVMCKNHEEAKRLYNQIEKDVLNEKRKYIYFSGIIPQTLKDKWVDKLIEKTGWARNKCMKTNNSYGQYVPSL